MDSLPEELQFRNITSKKKTIIEKQQRQVLPSNGTEQVSNFSSGSQIVFRIPIDNEWSIQMDSAWVVGNLQCENVDSAAFLVDDGSAVGTAATSRVKNLKTNQITVPIGTATPSVVQGVPIPILAQAESWESMLSRVSVYLNGSELERIDHYNYLESFKHNWCNNQNWCNLQAGVMGISQSVLDKSKSLLIGGQFPTGTTTNDARSNVLQIAFPLRYLGLMNINTLLPAYLLGQNSLEIRIWLSPGSELFCQGILRASSPNGASTQNMIFTDFTPSTSNRLSYRFSDIRMNLNYIQTEPSYNNALSQYLISNNLQIPIETYFVTQFPILKNSSGWITQNISIQYSNIDAIYCIFTRNTETSSAAYLGTDRLHFPEGLSQARLTVNGKVLPSVPILFTDPGYSNHVSEATGVSAVDGALTSGFCGVSNNYAPEALTYLMKALGYNTSAEMLGQVNFSRTETSRILFTPAAYENNKIQSIRQSSGQGMFYASNKAVHENNVLSANTLPRFGSCNPLECEEIFWKTPTYFALGWSMTRSDYSDEFELSGYNASSNSGIVQVGLQFGGTRAREESSITANATFTAPGGGTALKPFDNYTCWVFIQHTRVLDIGKDNAQVLY